MTCCYDSNSERESLTCVMRTMTQKLFPMSSSQRLVSSAFSTSFLSKDSCNDLTFTSKRLFIILIFEVSASNDLSLSFISSVALKKKNTNDKIMACIFNLILHTFRDLFDPLDCGELVSTVLSVTNMFTYRELDSSFDFFTIGSNATYKDFLEIVNLLISSSFNDLTDSRASRLSKFLDLIGVIFPPMIYLKKNVNYAKNLQNQSQLNPNSLKLNAHVLIQYYHQSLPLSESAESGRSFRSKSSSNTVLSGLIFDTCGVAKAKRSNLFHHIIPCSHGSSELLNF
ncbi:hypothetical protein AGLY_010407 [Aphis glycines]|uniref:Uncharacterized protein n=1 Tax=Aphis glycines TaxID=307491 RepID=A0A6G0TED4_APHGL|nr:hypothetical protein AGLY_010407 [Aphis glycines]